MHQTGDCKSCLSANGMIGIFPRNFPQELGRVCRSVVINAQPTTRETYRATFIKWEIVKVVYWQMEWLVYFQGTFRKKLCCNCIKFIFTWHRCSWHMVKWRTAGSRTYTKGHNSRSNAAACYPVGEDFQKHSRKNKSLCRTDVEFAWRIKNIYFGFNLIHWCV